MYPFAESLLRDVLMAQGLVETDACKCASMVMRVELAAGIVTQRNIEVWECAAKLYHLRGREVMPKELKERFSGKSRSQIHELIRRHGIARRKALREYSQLDAAS